MRWTVLLLALAACGSGKSKEECRAEAAAMKALFAGANLEAPGVSLDPRMKLVQRSDLAARPTYAPEIGVQANEIRFERAVSSTLDDLHARLAVTFLKNAEHIEAFYRNRPNPPDARTINLVVDEATSWGTVVDVVSTARRAGFTRPSFVFVLPSTGTPPPRAPIDDEIDKLVAGPPDNVATSFAEMVSQEVKRCPAATKVFGAVGGVEADNKAEYIAEAIPEALVECDCNVDLPNLRAVLWRVMVTPNPPRVLALDPDAPAETIKLPASTTWKDAAKRFTPALKNADLVVE